MYDWVGVAAELERHPSLINVHPCGRWTALHQAARSGESAVVEWLLHIRADTLMQNSRGETPLDVTHHSQIVDILQAARDNRFHPEVLPAVPAAVGGFLPQSEGGTVDNYYCPPGYNYEQTFQYLRTRKAFLTKLLCVFVELCAYCPCVN